MTDIIELAKKAGLTKGYIGMSGVSIDASSIEYFAALYKQALIDSGELVPAEKVNSEAFERWYNKNFRTRTVDTRHMADCEEAWEAAIRARSAS